MKPINPLYEWAVQNPNSTNQELIERQQFEKQRRQEQERIKERNKVIVASSIVVLIILFAIGLWKSELVRMIGVLLVALIGLGLVLAAIYSFVKEAVDAFMD